MKSQTFVRSRIWGVTGVFLLAISSLVLSTSTNAAIIINWQENLGDGNDVVAYLSGSYTLLEADKQNNPSSFLEMSSNRFADSRNAETYQFQRHGVSTLGFIGIFSSSATSTIQNFQDFGIFYGGRMIFSNSLNVGDTLTPTGRILFENQSFSSLFGAASVADFVRYEDSTGAIAVASAVAPIIPVPSAVWLFGSGLLGLIGIARRKKS